MSVHGSTSSRRVGRRQRLAARALPLALALLGLAGAVRAAMPPPEGQRPPAWPGSRPAVVEGGDLRVLQGRQVSMDEAIEMAQRRFNARVVRAEVAERDGRRVYVLRLLSDDGRVFNVRVDAATGSMQ